MIEGAFERAIGGAHKIHLPAEDANMPSARGFSIDLACQIDLQRAVDRGGWRIVRRLSNLQPPQRGIAHFASADALATLLPDVTGLYSVA